MTGVDAADAATQPSFGRSYTDYTPFLKVGALRGARIGVARDFMGADAGSDAVMEAAVATLAKLGAEVITVKYPGYVLESKQVVYNELVSSEFKAQITEYLHTLKPGFPKDFNEIVAKANDPATGYRSPEKAVALKYTASIARDLNDPVYLAIKNNMLPAVTAGVLGVFEKYKLDVIVYPTSPTPATLIKPDEATDTAAARRPGSATNIANATGFPDLIVPAGMTPAGLPVTISFFGPAWSEPKLLAYGYDFEQATKAIRTPKNTPVLPGETITY
jgi:amidase